MKSPTIQRLIPIAALFLILCAAPQFMAQTPVGSRAVIYAVADNNDLLWYRHDGRGDGSTSWTEPKKVGNGWNFKEVFYGGGGVIYAITPSGDLLWYRHDGHGDGSTRWTEPKKVGNGWNFRFVFVNDAGS